MSALFENLGKKNGYKPDFTGLQIQTAVATLPIPICYGKNKVSPNVIFYNNFQTKNIKAGKGAPIFSSTVGNNYTADVILALSEGPISGIGYVWRDQSTYTLSDLNLSLYKGTTPQTAWSYLATTYGSESLAYQGTAYVCAANYQLGSNASIGNHNFEVIGVLAGTGVNGVDADPAQVIYDFLTNAQYGAGFNPASMNLTTLYGTGGDASLQTYCKAMGIAFSPLLSSAEQGSSILNRWLQILNCAAVWSGGQLKFIPYGDVAINAGPQTKTVTTPVPIPGRLSNGVYPLPTIVVSTPANFVSDGGVVFTFNNKPLTYIGKNAPSSVGQYGISPAGTYVFHSGDQGSPVTITAILNTPVSYVPNLTPVYALTDTDFIDEKGNKDPVQVQRADPFSLPTVQRVECLSRNNQYASVPVEARDQSQIELYGMRIGSTIQAHEICDEIVMGPTIAQTILQRGLYVRTHFTFKLSFEYCLLDPMDIVTITDTNLGLSAFPVRIVSIEEDDKGLLTVSAEELVLGVSTPGSNPSNGMIAFQLNPAAAASAINPPLIYEPPPALTGNIAQIWVGASGVDMSNWGGAYVYASVDNATYSQIGVITEPLRQGVLTAALPSMTGWDTTDTLSINVSQSAATLSGTSAVSAQTGATLSLVDGELLAYQNAILTGTNTYNLTGLQRGFAGTAVAAHASGANFARLDSSVVQYNLPSTWIGVPLYFKFQSFNVFGAGMQALSTCSVYNYTPTGSSMIGPVTQALIIGTNLDFGNATNPLTEYEDWGGNVSISPFVNVDLSNIAS